MHWLDLLVVAVYILVVLGLGVWAGREEKDEEDFFLGGRSMPWLAVAVSIYATSASALTFIGVPGAAFKGDWVYLQLGIGDLIGRVLICVFLIPAYFRENVTTVYQLLGKRFGPRSQDAGTVFFLITRVLASGVRLAACAIAFAAIFDLPLNGTMVLITLIAMAYTTAGGIKAVIWTDTLQFLLFVGGALLVLGVIFSSLPEGIDTFLSVGSEAGKFRVLYLDWDFNNANNFVPGTILGMMTTFAVLGTDQDMVQRMLTTKTAGESQRALFLTALLNIPMTLLFLCVGAALFVFYQTNPDPALAALLAEGRNDYVFPHFIRTVLGPGLRGLLVAGLLAAAMSSLDSALNALSSTAYVDLYRKYWNPEQTPEQAVRTSRWLSLLFAGVLLAVALIFGHEDQILWLGFRMMGYTYGALLGVFLLAVWTDGRGSDTGNIVAMVSSVALVLYLTATPEGGGKPILAWSWAITVGTFWTLGVAALWPTPAVSPPAD